MFVRHEGTRRAASLLCLSILCGVSVRGATPVEPAAAPETSRIEGRVVRSNGKTPAEGAVVRAFHLDTGKTYSSEPAGRRGEFEISGLPYGYLDLTVETAEGVYLGNMVVNVPPGGSIAVRLALTPDSRGPADRWAELAPPGGVENHAAGVAEVRTRPHGREYWKSPAGLAIIGGSASAILLAIAASGDDEEVSPSTP